MFGDLFLKRMLNVLFNQEYHKMRMFPLLAFVGLTDIKHVSALPDLSGK